MLNNKFITKLSNLTLSTLVTYLVKFIKISFLVGSKTMLFSFSSIISPMIGALGGMRFNLLFFIVQSILNFLKFIFFGTSFLLIGYHIPQFFASFYWLNSSKWVRALVPAICFSFFIAHPVGQVAWLYTSFWLIPIIISFFAFDHIFFKALGSTFTAHAVGSVIWIYSLPMVPQDFISLMPIVVLERLIFACGMVSVYYFVNSVKSLKQQNIRTASCMIGFNDKAFSNNDGWK